jgi:CDP-diacylglycerol--glycerol-3-phosphate 3-phosphatidyltransferase
MALPGREEIRAALSQYVESPGARLFQAIGLTPNAITIIGFAICIASGYLVSNGWLLAGGVIFLVGGGLDMFDGALARLTGKASPFGALMDSVFDRLGEAALFVGIGMYFMRGDFGGTTLTFYVAILLLALIFSQGVSYLRARGEGLGAFTRDGVMTRTERVIILGVGLIADAFTGFPLIPWILLAIAVVSCFTLFQRMWTIRGLLEKGS